MVPAPEDRKLQTRPDQLARGRAYGGPLRSRRRRQFTIENEAQLGDSLQVHGFRQSSSQEGSRALQSAGHGRRIVGAALDASRDRVVDPCVAVIDGQDDPRDVEPGKARVCHLVSKETCELPLDELLQPRVPMAKSLVRERIRNANIPLFTAPGSRPSHWKSRAVHNTRLSKRLWV
jgi:hypothetical protein